MSLANSFYRGKVRDVYTFDGTDPKVVMITTNRISAFDFILPQEIPMKGEYLNGIAAHFLNATRDIVPNWLESCPHPNVMIGKRCEPIKVEMVIRGFLVGHAWREYEKGVRTLCGVKLPEGMNQYDPFPQPIITPTTKDVHDEDISKEEILNRGLATVSQYDEMEKYTQALYARGSCMAANQGLILVDTKFEFGLFKNQIYLIDEILTPDSSRYFEENDYKKSDE